MVENKTRHTLLVWGCSILQQIWVRVIYGYSIGIAYSKILGRMSQILYFRISGYYSCYTASNWQVQRTSFAR